MRGYFGYPGDVSFQPQVRIKAAYRGCADISQTQLMLSGLGAVSALPSGSYRGAPGVRARKETTMRQRDQDMMMFHRMGIPVTGQHGIMRSGALGVAGLGSVTDRQACAASFAVGSGLYNAVTGAVAASQAGETEAQRAANARLAAQLGAGATGVNALANLCNLANDGNPPVGSVNPQQLIQQELARIAAQRQADTLWQQQQAGAFSLTSGQPMSTGTKVALGVGAAAVIGLGAWFLFKK